METKESKAKPIILVVGGTGTQGGNVARELLAHGHRVRVLTRHPDLEAAQLLVKAGAEVVYGDMSMPETLSAALAGITAMFSVQYTDPDDSSVEPRNAYNLLQASIKAGVRQVVHTSSMGSDRFPRWNKHASIVSYWDHKWEIEDHIRNAGFDTWTILHPTWFMENFTETLAPFMNPELGKGIIFSALQPDTRVDMICGENIAAYARAAFEQPDLFHKQDITFAGESLTMGEAAAILTEVMGKKVTSVSLSNEAAVARGLYPSVVNSHDWMNDVGSIVDYEALTKFGIPRISFKHWVDKHKDKIKID
ncbi:SDR family oxidoreductase [Paenibacillus sp. FSL H8-0034]|uniref:SDR family oxidoreductase n=1 Tax=Paenibacillus sp. FSL H8-0034 TaxID=2954671 RepID=UPI0030FBC233